MYTWIYYYTAHLIILSLLAATKLWPRLCLLHVCNWFCSQDPGGVSGQGEPPQGKERPPPLAGRTPPGRENPSPGIGRTPRAIDPPGISRLPRLNSRHPPRSRHPPPREADCSIRSMSGRYASYWNAFLFYNKITTFAEMLSLIFSLLYGETDRRGPWYVELGRRKANLFELKTMLLASDSFVFALGIWQQYMSEIYSNIDMGFMAILYLFK